MYFKVQRINGLYDNIFSVILNCINHKAEFRRSFKLTAKTVGVDFLGNDSRMKITIYMTIRILTMRKFELSEMNK